MLCSQLQCTTCSAINYSVQHALQSTTVHSMLCNQLQFTVCSLLVTLFIFQIWLLHRPINCRFLVAFLSPSRDVATQSINLSELISQNGSKFPLSKDVQTRHSAGRGELSYLAPLGSENISAPYFKQCFFRWEGSITPQTESNTTPPSPKTEITNILFYI